ECRTQQRDGSSLSLGFRRSFVIRHSSFVISQSGFTFIEVLAAMLFLAILVPAVMQGLALSNRASVVAERSAIAVQLAENRLNELLLNDAWTTGETRGDFGEQFAGYRWELSRGDWSVDGMTELTLTVFFTVQGLERDVHLTTLASQS